MGRRLQRYEKLPGGHYLNNGRFKITRSINAGGFGIGYEADQISGLLRKVFIKEHFPKDYVMREEGDTTVALYGEDSDYEWSLNQFLDEGQLLASLPKEKGLVTIFETFEENGTAYMVMEYVEGIDVKSWLAGRREKGEGSPNESEILEILFPLLDGLAVAHEGILDRETGRKQPIIHRDIAADNIRLRQEDGSPVLLDFGSARPSSNDLVTVAVTAVVKRGYAPWELYQTTDKWQGPWTDIYALGALVHEMITGILPVEGHQRKVSDPYEPLANQQELLNRGYREKFLKAVDWALLVDEKARPQSIAEWRVELEPDVPEIEPQKHPLLIWSLIGMAAAIIAVVGFMLLKEPVATPPIVVDLGTENTAQGTENLETLFQKAEEAEKSGTGYEKAKEDLLVFLLGWEQSKPDVQTEELLADRLKTLGRVAERDHNELGQPFYAKLVEQFTNNLRIQDEMTSALEIARKEESIEGRLEKHAVLVRDYGQWSGTPANKFDDILTDVRSGIGERSLKESSDLRSVFRSSLLQGISKSCDDTRKLVESEYTVLNSFAQGKAELSGEGRQCLQHFLRGAEAEVFLETALERSDVYTQCRLALDDFSRTLLGPGRLASRFSDEDLFEVGKRNLENLGRFTDLEYVQKLCPILEKHYKSLGVLKEYLDGLNDPEKEASNIFGELVSNDHFREAVERSQGNLNQEIKDLISPTYEEWGALFTELEKVDLEYQKKEFGGDFIDVVVNDCVRKWCELIRELDPGTTGRMIALSFPENLNAILLGLGERGCDEVNQECSVAQCFLASAETLKGGDWNEMKSAALLGWRYRKSLNDQDAGRVGVLLINANLYADYNDLWDPWLSSCEVLNELLLDDINVENQMRAIEPVFLASKFLRDTLPKLIESKNARNLADGRVSIPTLLGKWLEVAGEAGDSSEIAKAHQCLAESYSFAILDQKVDLGLARKHFKLAVQYFDSADQVERERIIECLGDLIADVDTMAGQGGYNKQLIAERLEASRTGLNLEDPYLTIQFYWTQKIDDKFRLDAQSKKLILKSVADLKRIAGPADSVARASIAIEQSEKYLLKTK